MPTHDNTPRLAKEADALLKTDYGPQYSFVVNVNTHFVHFMDGMHLGGRVLAFADQSNVPAATAAIDGKMPSAAVVKLAGIQAGAQVNPSAADIIAMVGKGLADGLCPLGPTGVVPAQYLPASVGAVKTVFGRAPDAAGNVGASAGDYTAGQISVSTIAGLAGGTVQAMLADVAASLALKAPAAHVGAGGVVAHPDATTTASGFMPAVALQKLNNIEAGAQVNLTPAQLAASLGKGAANGVASLNALGKLSAEQIPTDLGVVKTVHGRAPDAAGNVGGAAGDYNAGQISVTTLPSLPGTTVQAALASADTALAGKAATAHTHPDATTSAGGFMSAADKVKLNGIEPGATADMTRSELETVLAKGQGGGLCDLDPGGLVPSSRLPGGTVTGVTAGTYTNPLISVDSYGRVTAVTSGSPGAVTSLGTVTCTGNMNFNADNIGLRFNSTSNPGGDYASIYYVSDNNLLPGLGDGSENGCLLIAAGDDSRTSNYDSILLSCGAAVIVAAPMLVFGIGARTNAEHTITIGSNANTEGGHDNVIAIGASAVASGYKTVSVGPWSLAESESQAYGPHTIAKKYSIAIGRDTESHEEYSIAMGRDAKTYSQRTICFGRNARVDAGNNYVIALGDAVRGYGEGSIVVGRDARTERARSISLGYNSHTWGDEAISIGYNARDTGTRSVTIGVDAKAGGDASVAVGQLAKTHANMSVALGWNAQCSYASSVALGESASPTGDHRVAIGSAWQVVEYRTTPVNVSDVRTKRNVRPLPLGLDFIRSLRPVAYQTAEYLGRDGFPITVNGTRTHCGLIAQELATAVADTGENFALVAHSSYGERDGEDLWSANYTEVIPVTVQGIKEIDAEVQGLRAEVIELRAIINKLVEKCGGNL